MIISILPVDSSPASEIWLLIKLALKRRLFNIDKLIKFAVGVTERVKSREGNVYKDVSSKKIGRGNTDTVGFLILFVTPTALGDFSISAM
jgi:hypothetical protein